jgi:MFS family permease
VLSPTIMAETGMNAQEFGRLVTFFFVAYTLGNPLWGSVLDFVGLRIGMLVAVAIWTTALKVALYNFPREQAAMMSGIAYGAWALLNAGLAEPIGRLFDQQRWSEAFWLVALCPTVGIAVWLFLSRDRQVREVREVR